MLLIHSIQFIHFAPGVEGFALSNHYETQNVKSSGKGGGHFDLGGECPLKPPPEFITAYTFKDT